MIKLILKDFERCRKFFIGMTITLAVLIFAVINSGSLENVDNPKAFALLPGIYFFIIVYICFLRNVSKEHKYNTTDFLESLPVKPSEVIAAKFLFPLIINVGLLIICVVLFTFIPRFLPGNENIARTGSSVIFAYASLSFFVLALQFLGISFIGYKPTFLITFVLAFAYLVFSYLIPVITNWGEVTSLLLDNESSKTINEFFENKLKVSSNIRSEIFAASIFMYFIAMLLVIAKRNFRSRVKSIFADMKSGNMENMFK